MSSKVEKAEAVAAALVAAGRSWSARVWDGDTSTRVYVTERLSRGTKECGYVEILDGGFVNVNPISNGPKAAIREVAKRAIEALA